jgi:hypothetical protein
VLHILFIKAQLLGESQRMVHAVCSAHDMKGTNTSPHRPVLLHGASNSERDYQEEKVVNGLPTHIIGYSSSASL